MCRSKDNSRWILKGVNSFGDRYAFLVIISAAKLKGCRFDSTKKNVENNVTVSSLAIALNDNQYKHVILSINTKRKQE